MIKDSLGRELGLSIGGLNVGVAIFILVLEIGEVAIRTSGLLVTIEVVAVRRAVGLSGDGVVVVWMFIFLVNGVVVVRRSTLLVIIGVVVVRSVILAVGATVVRRADFILNLFSFKSVSDSCFGFTSGNEVISPPSESNS